MKNNKKGKSRTGAIVLLAFLTLVFIAMAFIMFVADMDYLISKKTTSIGGTTEWHKPQKDDHVTVESYAVLGKYAQTKHYINGFIPSGTDYHYILWLNNDAAISVTVKNKKLIKELDELETLTWEVLDGESDYYPEVQGLTGQVSTMDPEIEGYYDDYLEEIGFTDAGFDIYYVTIDTSETWFTAWMYVLFFVVLAIVCIVSMIANVKRAKKEKLAAAQLAGAANGQMNGTQPYNPSVDSMMNQPINPISDQNNDIYRQ